MGIDGGTKQVIELFQNVDNADLYRKIIDLSGEIYEMHGGFLELEEQVRDLKDQLEIKQAMEFRQEDGFYYQEGDSVPYCPICWENLGKAIHLKKYEDFGSCCDVCSDNRR